MEICNWIEHTNIITEKLIPEKIRMHEKVILNELIKYRFGEADLVRLKRVRNHLKLLYMSKITKGNGKRIKTLTLNGIQDYTTKRKSQWRQEKTAEEDYKIWKIAMNRLASDRFLPYTLGKWIQKSHNKEMWTFDAKKNSRKRLQDMKNCNK